MGRARKPTALKILHGDFAKDPQRRNHNEPTPEVKPPAKPATLKGESLKEWKRVTVELESMKVLTECDRAAVQQYAELWGRWYEAMLIVRREGVILFSESGAYEHPASKIASRCCDQIHKYLCQFGLTPASRSRVNVTQQTAPIRMRRQR
jgi:P27 family predicted phage terminase small subunit